MTDQGFSLGVDGGGSGCRAAIGDANGVVIGNGHAGPANATTNFGEAVSNVQAAISMALAEAGLRQDALHSMQAHIGLAGILSQADADRLKSQLSIPQARVTDDRPTNLAGALGGKTGLLAAVGTGSFIGAQSG
ncbi:N-acetylglucosamine kinase, partial [bacterium]|nr:N-acetylglucosamine kinase [bacterium]